VRSRSCFNRSITVIGSNPAFELVVRYHGTSIHVDHAMSTGNQSVNGRRWNGGADGAVVQMERWNGGADGNTPNGFLIFEKIFTGFVGPPSPSTLCAGPAYPPSIDPARAARGARGARDQQQPGISSSPGSAAARDQQQPREPGEPGEPGREPGSPYKFRVGGQPTGFSPFADRLGAPR
jgi:hypothetical protein